MSMMESEDQEPNTVTAVMQKGYKLEGTSNPGGDGRSY